MTWEDLIEKGKEFGYIGNEFCLRHRYGHHIHFWRTGRISYDYPDDSFVDIAYNRTPDQMYQIMLALRENKNKLKDKDKV